MQEFISIDLSSIIIDAISGDSSKRTTTIQHELEQHIKEISSMLTAYHWDERGIVHGVTIDEPSISIDKNGQGKFRVKYGTNIHFGCSDKDIELDNSMVITINADLTTGTALLTGENVIEREPDDI
jgi:histidinol phosphatase-like enzyme